MTARHHTPHAIDAPLSSTELDRPHQELDAAIDALVISASGTTTTLDGSAASGQKVIPLTSTNSLAVGATALVTDGTNSEPVVIGSISAGVSVTVVADLAHTYSAGAAFSVSPAEIALARGGFSTLGSRLTRAIANVADYGPTGTSDDTATFALALSALNIAGGGVLYFQNHTVGTLTIPPNVILRGWGPAASKLTLKTATDASLVVIPTASTGGRIEDCTLDGNKANNSGTSHCVDADGYAPTLRNVTMQNAVLDGFHATSGAGAYQLENCIASFNGRDGYSPWASDGHLRDCWASMNGRWGLWHQSVLCNVNGGGFFWNQQGVHVEGHVSTGPAGKLTIGSNCDISNNLEAGVHITAGSYDTKYEIASIRANGQVDFVSATVNGRPNTYPATAGRHANVYVASTTGDHYFGACTYSDDTGVTGWLALAASADSDDILHTGATHNFVAGDRVRFATLTGGSGVDPAVTYYVIAANLASTTFQVSATLGGGAASLGSDITAGTVGVLIHPNYNFYLESGCSVMVGGGHFADTSNYSVALSNTPSAVVAPLGPGVVVAANNTLYFSQTEDGVPIAAIAMVAPSAGVLSLSSALRISTASTVSSGSGAPSGGTPSAGDLYIRTGTPTTSDQRLYMYSGSAWVGIL